MSTIVPTQPWYLRALTTAGLVEATTFQTVLLALALLLGWYESSDNDNGLSAWLLLGLVFTISAARSAAGLPLPGLPYDVANQRWLLGSQTGACIALLLSARANAALAGSVATVAAAAAHHLVVIGRHRRRQAGNRVPQPRSGGSREQPDSYRFESA